MGSQILNVALLVEYSGPFRCPCPSLKTHLVNTCSTYNKNFKRATIHSPLASFVKHVAASTGDADVKRLPENIKSDVISPRTKKMASREEKISTNF